MDEMFNEYMSNAKASFVNGAYENVIASCKQALQLAPANIEVYSLLGQAYLVLERLSEAEDTFRKALSIEENSELYFNLGNSLFGQERISEALTNYAKADELGCSDEIKQKMYYVMGVINQLQGNNQDALVSYKKSEDIAKINNDQKDILLKQIQIYVNNKDYENAEKYAREFKLLVPGEFKSYQLLIQILLEQDKIKQALSVLNEAKTYCNNDLGAYIEINFDYAMIDCYMARLDNNNEHYLKAIERLDKLSNTAGLPLDVQYEIKVTIAEIYLKLNELDKAIDYANEVANKTDEDLLVYIERAVFILAETYATLKDYKKVLEYAKRLKNSKDLGYHYHGYYLETYAMNKMAKDDDSLKEQALNLSERAIAYYRKCLAVSPNDILSSVYRTKLYADLGKYDKAEELVKIFPEPMHSDMIKYIDECKNKIN